MKKKTEEYIAQQYAIVILIAKASSLTVFKQLCYYVPILHLIYEFVPIHIPVASISQKKKEKELEKEEDDNRVERNVYRSCSWCIGQFFQLQCPNRFSILLSFSLFA